MFYAEVAPALTNMSLYIPMHKHRHMLELTVPEMIAYRQILKKKLKYYRNLYDAAALAEEENQDDYGMLATVQAEMDFAETKMMRCENKKDTIDRMIVFKSISIWKKNK
jgi:hypothetical protein